MPLRIVFFVGGAPLVVKEFSVQRQVETDSFKRKQGNRVCRQREMDPYQELRAVWRFRDLGQLVEDCCRCSIM